MMLDCLGNPLSDASPAALAGIDDFVSGFLGYRPKAANILNAADADPESPLAQIYAGMLWMFLESPAAPANARVFLDRAIVLNARANAREKALAGVLDAWVANDMPRAEAGVADILQRWPTDLATLKLGQYFAFNRGDAATMLALAHSAAPANQENANFHAMAAFAHEQSHQLKEAEAAARHALEIDKAEPWAHHALAHVMLTQGRVPEGSAFLAEAAPSWEGLNSFMYTHNWWHRALFALSLGDEALVYAMYDDHCWSMEKTYSQDQIGAVSLLARMEMAGMDVGDRWDELAGWLKERHADTVNTFLTLQYIYGLKRAGRAESNLLMEAIRDKAATAPSFEAVVWREVALPTAEAIIVHLEGRHAEAAATLARVLPRMAEAGGSHAQRDLFEQILLDALIRSGEHRSAKRLMEMRRTFDPCGIPLNRMLARTCRQLGLEGEAQEAEARSYG